jgi:hypothetical protein
MAKKWKIWLSATSAGEQGQLGQIISVLTSLDYEVFNSHDFINDSQDDFVLDKHLSVLTQCNLFLGIINAQFIKTEVTGDDIFLKEFEKAIECKIPYWYLVHRDVTFVRSLFKKMKCSDTKEIELADDKLFDKRTIEVYNYVIDNYIRAGNGASNNLQSFSLLNELADKLDHIFIEPGDLKRLMIGSTVYGFEDQLSKIVSDLESKKFKVLNSHYGSIKVNPRLSNLDNSLEAVKESELFLGIIRPYYGTGNIAGMNITFEEIKKAIELKHPAWFLVHRNVEFADKLFKRIRCSDDNKPELTDNKIIDERSIELYDAVIKDDVKELELRNGNWVQEYNQTSGMMIYIDTQFSDQEFISQILTQKENNDGQ